MVQVVTLETNIRFGTKNPNEAILYRGSRQILHIRRRTPELLTSSLLFYCRILGVDPNEVK
jgi:hypothetical protein